MAGKETDLPTMRHSTRRAVVALVTLVCSAPAVGADVPVPASAHDDGGFFGNFLGEVGKSLRQMNDTVIVRGYIHVDSHDRSQNALCWYDLKTRGRRH